ncbi:platelet glycoprotein VI isoform 3 precursor [Daubentonia madagascariensis]|uniref:Platelet glycoprotein VI isoform 3 n=1 Tax=Daubentonia madagascariensis TaxID=31869 RepID=A0ABD2D7H9_DAUMA
MSPSPSALFCLGLCLGQVPAQSRPLPKPTLQAVPSSLVPLEKPVTIRCQGPPGVDLYRLEKLRSGKYEDQAFLFIPAMKREHTGRYRCSYQNGSRWSPPSDQLELVATGVYDKPLLLAKPSPAVSPGGDVTLQCQTPYSFDQFALYKEGDPRPYRSPERWYLASFPIITVTAAHSGTYRCYSFSSSNPYMWSAPSNPLELVVTETFRNITSSPEESPIAPARQHYTKGNLARICLGAVILILLAGLLAEDWHSRRRPLLHRVRAVQRPLPPLPQAQKSQGCQDRGQADARYLGLCS